MFIEMPKSWSITSKCDIISNLESWNWISTAAKTFRKKKKAPIAHRGLPGGPVVRSCLPVWKTQRGGFGPWLGRSPEGENGSLPQHSCWKFHGQTSLAATVHGAARGRQDWSGWTHRHTRTVTESCRETDEEANPALLLSPRGGLVLRIFSPYKILFFFFGSLLPSDITNYRQKRRKNT